MTHRQFGPLARLDPHPIQPDGKPATASGAPAVLYVAGNLSTAIGEVFGDYPEAQICPHHRIALLRPITAITVLDLRSQGAAMRIGALPSLATGDYPRARTQEWARAIYEDQPVHHKTVRGVYYSAAHTSGPALALWDTRDEVRVIDRPEIQDYRLNDPRMWRRIQTEAVKLGLRATLTSDCMHN